MDSVKVFKARLSFGRVALYGLAMAGAVFAGAAFSLLDLRLLLLLIVAACLLPIVVLKPQWFFLGSLLVRASLDVFADWEVVGGLNLAGILGVMILPVAGWYIFVNRVRVLRVPLVIPYVAFLIAGVFTFFRSADIFTSVSDWIRFASNLSVYIVIYDMCRERQDCYRVMVIALLSSIVPLSFGVWQYLTGTFDFVGRITSTFVVANVYGYYLAYVLLLIVALLSYLRSGKIRFILLVLAGLSVVSLILTHTRGAMVSLAAGGGVLLLFNLRKLGKYAFLGIVLVVILFVSPLSVALGSFDVLRTSTMLSRLAVWEKGWELFESQPILGVGLGVFNAATIIGGGGEIHRGVHNDYLRLLAEVGAIGFLAYMWFVVRVFWNAYSLYSRSVSTFAKMLSLLLISLWVAQALGSLTNNLIGAPVLEWYVWSLSAAALALASPRWRGSDLVIETPLSPAAQGGVR